MEAKALNKATPVNLAHHSYWNLGGQNSGDILANEIQIFGSHITHVDKDLIPTGNIATVKGTPYDFLHPTTIESKIKQLPNGYDINYVLDGHTRELKTAAIVYDKRSGRVMEVLTNQPGLQFYTGNHIKDVKGKDGFVYEAHAGLCLETQGFPDSVNHPNFPSQIVTPGKMYVHRMLFKFSTKAA
ncbi:aldose 1-epimerase [Sarracenia purpurea var. burkii]